MRKFTAILTAAFMVLSLAACSSEEARHSSVSAEAEAPSAAETVTGSEQSAAAAKPETAEAETAPETVETETAKPETTAPKPVSDPIGGYGADKGAPSVPGESKPEVSVPEASEPEIIVPETSEPEIIAPETVEPETTAPEEPEQVETEEPEAPAESISDPVTLLKNTWALFGEDERFPVTGGDFSTGELLEEAGSFSLEEPDTLDYVCGFPAAEIEKIDSAATLMHMMNQNTFTAGAFHMAEGANINEVGKAVRDNILSRQWMCGFPDKMIVANVGDYLVCAFGKNQQVDAFTKHLAEAYPITVIVADEPIL